VSARHKPSPRPATSAGKLVTSPANAKTLPKRVLDVVVSVVAVQLKSATSAQRSATLPATALKLVATEVVTVETRVDTVETKADTVVEAVDRPATPAVATVTCLVTAHKVRSATTAAKLAISPVTAQPRLLPRELATSASNLVTFRLNAPTKDLYMWWRTNYIESDHLFREDHTTPGILKGRQGLRIDLRCINFPFLHNSAFS